MKHITLFQTAHKCDARHHSGQRGWGRVGFTPWLRARRFLLAVVLGMSCALSTNVVADDTEIYLGPKAVSANVRPNVLFILDSSGSMGWSDAGETGTRMQRMKDAMDVLLSNTSNVNVGIMRFTLPGGPVLFPISHISDDAHAIAPVGYADVNIQISDSDDDAEEFAVSSSPALGEVILDSVQLELMDTPAFAPEQFFIGQVAAGTDDAEQCETATPIYDASDDVLESVDNGVCTQHVGLRFTGLPTDTDNAVVLRAEIDFVAQSTRDDDVSLTFFGHNVGDSGAFTAQPQAPGCGFDPTADTDIVCRLSHTTAASVQWPNLPDTVSGDVISSPDLGSIVQELFDHSDWQAGGANDALTLMYSGQGNGQRDFYAQDAGVAVAPNLRIDYVPQGAPAGAQLIGLRFRDVPVAQGIDILNAVVEFTAAEESSEPSSMMVYGEAADDAAPFSAAAGDLSARYRTSAAQAVSWDLDASDVWSRGEAVQTPNLAGIVQEVVDRPGWCGGNDMVFFFEAGSTLGRRIVRSFDDAPGAAPKLRISYDENTYLTSGEGCTVQEVMYQVGMGSDDAREHLDDNAVATNATALTLGEDDSGTDTAVGLRFQNLEISSGAQVLSAQLELMSTQSMAANSSTLTVKGHLSGDAPTFSGAAGDISSRPNTTASVTYATPTADVLGANERFVSADIGSVISEIINGGSGWAFGNNLALIVTGTNAITGRAYEASAAQSATLRIKVRQNLGDLSEDFPLVPVRERLRDIVGDLPTDGGTPVVDTLYEAARYFRGETIVYGAARNGETTRVSHPATYTGGTLFREAGCTDDNLNAPECASERIDGTPTYVSPITDFCQANYIVLLTDGYANSNHSVERIKTMTGVSQCDATLPDGTTAVADGEACALDLVRWLSSNDQGAAVSGENFVSTYTIGFNFSTDWLRALAEEGNGSFYEASSAADLAAAFEEILAEVLDASTSFAAPSLSINAVNKLYHNNETYFSLFKPSKSAAWDGNVKKYALRDTCTGVTGPCTLGELLDSDSVPAVGADGRIVDGARSLWSTTADGTEITSGGAGANIPAHATRRVLTFTDTSVAATATINESLGFSGPHALVDANGDGTLDGLVIGSGDEKLQATKDLLSFPGEDVATLDAAGRAQLVTDLKTHIDWIRGKDVDDLYDDADFGEQRYAFSDPLHGSPVVINYGGTADEPITKLVVGTNDGGIRMINGHSGVEEWIFYPPAMLGMQTTLRTNSSVDHAYGIDATPTVWTKDHDNDGIIEPADGDFVRMFTGMRRGGDYIYALDLTPPSTFANGLTDRTSVGDIQPKFMWRLKGSGTEYARLGQTWSQPKLITLDWGDASAVTTSRRKVLIFGGGYDPDQDSGFGGTDDLGNAIYLVDPLTGSRLHYFSADAVAAHGAGPGTTVADMLYPIPSELAVLDSDGDGAEDRIYVGDLGGQVWRIDLRPVKSATASGLLPVVGKLATVSGVAHPQDHRKFFYPPDVVQVRTPSDYAVGQYEIVSLVSGDRTSPLSNGTQDRFFSLRDLTISDMNDDGSAGGVAGDGIADGYATIQGALKSPATGGDLMDVSVVNFADGAGATDAELTLLISSRGYYLNLTGSGEKGLSTPITLAGRTFFTTYLPETVVASNSCSLAEGGGRMYGLNVLNGAAGYDWDGPDADAHTLSDRFLPLGSGIPSTVAPLFQPEGVQLIVGTGGGASVIDPNIQLERARTYWYQSGLR